MKRYAFILSLVAFSLSAYPALAQKWKQRMLEQIAALKVYQDYLKKGYVIVTDGARMVGDIKNGEFGLHQRYFDSLSVVSSQVKKYPKVQAITQMYQSILKLQEATTKLVTSSVLLSPGEAASIKKVLHNLKTDASVDMEQLNLVITDGKLQLTDDQRLRQIDDIYSRMQKRYSYQRAFSQRVSALVAWRKQAKKDMKVLREIQGNGR